MEIINLNLFMQEKEGIEITPFGCRDAMAPEHVCYEGGNGNSCFDFDDCLPKCPLF